jgi:chaperone required for assembly of F1-ATPase
VKRGAKRFYKTAAAREEPNGFAILLDGKAVKTPAGHSLMAPVRALAEAIAAEWRDQGDFIDPASMPLTRYANTVIDRVEPRRNELIADLAKYAGHDLLCYREAASTQLMQRQATAWDPWLAWAADRCGADLIVGQGVGHIEQPPDALEALRLAIAAHDAHRLAVLHTGITITGSAVLGLAFTAGALSAREAFEAAHVDELFQEERWGADAEAQQVRARKLAELKAGENYLELLP